MYSAASQLCAQLLDLECLSRADWEHRQSLQVSTPLWSLVNPQMWFCLLFIALRKSESCMYEATLTKGGLPVARQWSAGVRLWDRPLVSSAQL